MNLNENTGVVGSNFPLELQILKRKSKIEKPHEPI